MASGTAIHWFRRDLRILDNTALYHSQRDHDHVVPIYVLSEWSGQHQWTGPNRQQFLCDSLESLSKNIESLNGRLIVRSGDAIEVLEQLVKETKAEAIYFNRDPDPYGKSVEKALSKKCEEWDVKCVGCDDLTMHTPDDILTQSDEPYRVYTPYSKNWLQQDKAEPLPKPGKLNTPGKIKSEKLPDISHWGLKDPAKGIIEAGERAALDRLKSAIDDTLREYADKRDVPSVKGTSRLSQDLRHGLLSVRTIYKKVADARSRSRSSDVEESFLTYIKELAWREFYMAILHHYPEVLEEEFNSDWRGLPWDEPGEKFEAWKEGRTGFPIVDAGMRELKETGYMHNRLRMITAMFLTKDLHIDWRLGESYFMQQLVDGEIASNNGGWQWSAGTGADAAPYFRIQNPWLQSKRHDPEGKYIKKWVTELKDVKPASLHKAPDGDKPIAKDYVLPCVDHSEEREKTLSVFKKHKNQSGR